MTRYVAGDDAPHRCCYSASVRDTMRKDYPGQTKGALVCECPDKEQAEKIAVALELYESTSASWIKDA